MCSGRFNISHLSRERRFIYNWLVRSRTRLRRFIICVPLAWLLFSGGLLRASLPYALRVAFHTIKIAPSNFIAPFDEFHFLFSPSLGFTLRAACSCSNLIPSNLCSPKKRVPDNLPGKNHQVPSATAPAMLSRVNEIRGVLFTNSNSPA